MLKKLVVFDFDGVLVNTLDMSLAINKQMRPEMTREEYLARHEGNVIKSFADHIVDSYKVFYAEYGKKLRHQEIIPELVAVIRALQKSYALAIISSTPTVLIEEHLALHDLREAFVKVIGGEVHVDKTHKLTQLLKEQVVSAGDAVFITDTLGDIREATKAGVKTIAVTWGFHPEATLASGNPGRIVQTTAELVPAVVGWFASSTRNDRQGGEGPAGGPSASG